DARVRGSWADAGAAMATRHASGIILETIGAAPVYARLSEIIWPRLAFSSKPLPFHRKKSPASTNARGTPSPARRPYLLGDVAPGHLGRNPTPHFSKRERRQHSGGDQPKRRREATQRCAHSTLDDCSTWVSG